MYRTCLFCKKPLGSNEVLESFPVGRRLAFDAEKGRLWALCRKCRRWNLTPLEERWEAIEECERLFRGTRARVSTENIGIARHPEGLELVRIGKPRRPEFAAWRYGDQMGDRRRRNILYGATGVAGGALLAPAILTAPPLALLPFSLAAWPFLAWVWFRPMARVRVGGDRATPTTSAPGTSRSSGFSTSNRSPLLPHPDEPGFAVQIRKGGRKARFAGEDAQRVAAAVVPQLNGQGVRLAWYGTRLAGSSPAATRAGFCSTLPGTCKAGSAGWDMSGACQSRQGWRWKWPFTRNRSGVRSKASCGGWNRRGRRRKRSPRSRTTCCFRPGARVLRASRGSLAASRRDRERT